MGLGVRITSEKVNGFSLSNDPFHQFNKNYELIFFFSTDIKSN
jgi:hypothetical protein